MAHVYLKIGMLWSCLCLISMGIIPSSATTLDFNYHNYKQLSEYLHRITRDSSLAKIYSIGKSVKNRDLWIVEISASNSSVLGIPNVKLVGNIHGNEAVGREVLLHLIEYLVINYPTDETVKWLLDNTRIHVLASMNPDGYELSREGTCKGGSTNGRGNQNNMDLNRNFPDYFANNAKPEQPEMQAIKKWLDSRQFVLSAGLHGGALVASYPFDSTEHDRQGLTYKESITPDNDVFKHLALVYANTHPTMHHGAPCNGGKQEGFKDGITNGAKWYSLLGGMQDYNYWAHGCMEITLEIGCCKFPNATLLPGLWNENRQALLKYVSQAHLGVRGVILDYDTQTPISGVQLQIDDRFIQFKTNYRGEFWRILLPGNYQLRIAAPGYVHLNVSFTVADQEDKGKFNATWLNVYLFAVLPDGKTQPTTATATPVIASTGTATATNETDTGRNVMLDQMVRSNLTHDNIFERNQLNYTIKSDKFNASSLDVISELLTSESAIKNRGHSVLICGMPLLTFTILVLCAKVLL